MIKIINFKFSKIENPFTHFCQNHSCRTKSQCQSPYKVSLLDQLHKLHVVLLWSSIDPRPNRHNQTNHADFRSFQLK